MQHRVHRSPAWMALKGVREHDEHDDGGPSDSCVKARAIHSDNIATDRISKREVARYGNEDVGCRGTSDAGQDNASSSKVTWIAEFVQN